MTVYYFKKLFAVYGFLLLCEFKPTGIKNVGWLVLHTAESLCIPNVYENVLYAYAYSCSRKPYTVLYKFAKLTC